MVTITKVLAFEEEAEEVQPEEEEVNHTLLQEEEQEVEEVVTTTEQELTKAMFSATSATSLGIIAINAEVEQQQKPESKQILLSRKQTKLDLQSCLSTMETLKTKTMFGI